MNLDFYGYLDAELDKIKHSGLFKSERIIDSPQKPELTLADGRKVINFCANNYLGFSDHPHMRQVAAEALAKYGYGMSSVRFICGTQTPHIQLEQRISQFFGTEDSILYAACFDANGGLFEPLLNENDAIISDALNHASIIDGVRLCKAQRFRYANADMADLEIQLRKASDCRFKLIVTDGVFSMDGNVAPLDEIFSLASRYEALIMVDESHSAGVVGPGGGGITQLYPLRGKIDIITGTLGKAFGGAIGGFTTGRRPLIEMLRQRSRPYLFSNSLPPMVASAGVAAFDLLETQPGIHKSLQDNVHYFVDRIVGVGFDVKPTASAIVAVMLYDAPLSQLFAARLLDEGIYVMGFFYPVVPQGQARIRVQLSAAHSRPQMDKALEAFIKIGRELKII